MTAPAPRTWWSDEENARLRKEWKKGLPTKRMAAKFPGRTPAAILKHGYTIGLGELGRKRERFSPSWLVVKELLKVQSPLSVSRIAAITGLSLSTVHRQLVLHEGKETRIADYLGDAHNAPYTPYWELGSAPSKPLQKPSKTEKNRARWERYKKEYPEVLEIKAARQRARQECKTIRRDVAASWI